jgi:intein-encoded DNA endonuclease-like protein
MKPRIKLTDEIKKQMINMYLNEGMNTIEIGSYFNCDPSTVGKVLKNNDIDIQSIAYERSRVVDCDQEKKICEKYKQGLTVIEISIIYNISDGTVANVLKRNNIKLRPNKIRSKVKNHNYFESINTNNKAYFLGLILTDGSVVESKTRENRSKIVSIELHMKDIDILYKFAEELGAPKDIVKINTERNHCYLRFASEIMAEHLSKYGVVPRKSLTTYLPQLEENKMPHLIRGIFDGNGTNYIISDKHIRFGFYGTKIICEQIKEYLQKEIKAKDNKIIEKIGCYMILWSGDIICKKFYDLIYTNAEECYLKRKRNKFDIIFDN